MTRCVRRLVKNQLANGFSSWQSGRIYVEQEEKATLERHRQATALTVRILKRLLLAKQGVALRYWLRHWLACRTNLFIFVKRECYLSPTTPSVQNLACHDAQHRPEGAA